MALLHQATLTPSKIELADAWVRSRPWFEGDGELAAAEASLIGTLHHSVLGQRWVYDAAGDPVYLQTLATTVLSGGAQVEMWIDEGAGLVQREPRATVEGAGHDAGYEAPLVDASSITLQDLDGLTVLHTPGITARLVRQPGQSTPDGILLTGEWTGHPASVALAGVTLS